MTETKGGPGMRGLLTICAIMFCLPTSSLAATLEERHTGATAEECPSIPLATLEHCHCLCPEGYMYYEPEKACWREQHVRRLALFGRGAAEPIPLPVCPEYILPEDSDGDGYSTIWDCDDVDQTRSPGLPEDCSNGIDNDCDGALDGDDTDCGATPAGNDPDGDGILNGNDYCPNKAETFNGYDDEDGCPEFDHDSDGIPTAYDKCPEEPGAISADPEQTGCPGAPASAATTTPSVSTAGESVPVVPGPTSTATLSTTATAEKRDSDGDGIPDSTDAAPNLAEDLDGFCDEDGDPEEDCDKDMVLDTEEAPGCELKRDCDGDLIEDLKDRCDTEPETRNGFEDEDGCPDEAPDKDGDGITGFDEKCPDRPEDFDSFEDEDGCPDPDNDDDGICDQWVSNDPNLVTSYEIICSGTDQCEFSAEDTNGFEDEDGCPEGLSGPKLAAAKAKAKREVKQAERAEKARQTKISSLVWENGRWLSSQYTGNPTDTDEDSIPDDLDMCPDDLEDLDLVDDYDGCRDWDVNGHIQAQYQASSQSLFGIRIIDVDPQWFMDVAELTPETAPAKDAAVKPILDLTDEAKEILDDAARTMKRYNITLTVAGYCPKPEPEHFADVDYELERRTHALRDYLIERATAHGVPDPAHRILVDADPNVVDNHEHYGIRFVPGL